MKKLILVLACFSLFVFPVTAEEKIPSVPSVVQQSEVKLPDKEDVAQYLQDISVTIRAGRAEGSGVITNVSGQNYVLTAGHVVTHLRRTREVIDPKTGAKKSIIEFDDAEVVKDLIEDGRTVGQMRFFAEVLRYSDAEDGEDLAILRVRKKDLVQTRVCFYLDDKIPALGTDLYHVGSLLGQGGSNSMTNGIYSQIGRLHNGQVYDQTNCAAFPGSSGGGIYLRDGRYVAMVVRGAGETFNLVVPVRRVKSWSKRVGIYFILDPKETVPSLEELKKSPVEELNIQGHKDSSKPSGGTGGHGFLIKNLGE